MLRKSSSLDYDISKDRYISEDIKVIKVRDKVVFNFQEGAQDLFILKTRIFDIMFLIFSFLWSSHGAKLLVFSPLTVYAMCTLNYNGGRARWSFHMIFQTFVYTVSLS